MRREDGNARRAQGVGDIGATGAVAPRLHRLADAVDLRGRCGLVQEGNGLVLGGRHVAIPSTRHPRTPRNEAALAPPMLIDAKSHLEPGFWRVSMTTPVSRNTP